MKHYIFLSSCAWSVMLQRPHHMARELAELGHRVSFVEPVGLSVNGNGSPPEEELVRLSLQNKRIEGNGIEVFRPVGEFNKTDVFPRQIVLLLGALLKSTNMQTVFIAYYPNHAQILRQLKGSFKIIYDCVDDHEDLEFSYWSSRRDIDDEVNMLKSAFATLTTSSGLYLKKGLMSEHVYLSNNAVNPDDFLAIDDVPEDLQLIPEPRVCYVGAVFDWFDEQLFYDVIDRNPSVSFVVIGPIKSGLLDRSRSNLHVLGVKQHSELRKYLRHSTVGIIPFKHTIDIIIHCDPIKMYEYIASGLPVVSTPLPEVASDLPFVEVCQDAEAFSNAIRTFITNSPDFHLAESFIESNTWRTRAEQLERIVDKNILPEDTKSVVLNRMREGWADFAQDNRNPILTSMYALTYATEDVVRFAELAERAYRALPTKYTLANYIRAVCECGQVDTAMTTISTTADVSLEYKAELAFAMREQNTRLVKILLLYFTNQIGSAKTLIAQLEGDHGRLALAHYLYLTGYVDEAAKTYGELFNSKCSPLLLHHLSSAMLRKGAVNAAQRLELLKQSSMDLYLERPNHVQLWMDMFSEPAYCPRCNNLNLTPLFTRPDNQRIVLCERCDLGLLSAMPREGENLSVQKSRLGIDQLNTALPDQSARWTWVKQTTTAESGMMLCINAHLQEIKAYFPFGQWEIFVGNAHDSQIIATAQKDGNSYSHRSLSERFDAITLWDILGICPTPLSFLRDLNRMLKPNGRLYVSAPNLRKGMKSGHNWPAFNTSLDTLFYFTSAGLSRMLADAGFLMDECFSHDEADKDVTNVKLIGDVLLASAIKI